MYTAGVAASYGCLCWIVVASLVLCWLQEEEVPSRWGGWGASARSPQVAPASVRVASRVAVKVSVACYQRLMNVAMDLKGVGTD